MLADILYHVPIYHLIYSAIRSNLYICVPKDPLAPPSIFRSATVKAISSLGTFGSPKSIYH
jgi:hypothetical protein